ncbi:hypothetical protein WJX81_000639 [Elliptochloris bilobata]|uniref:Protein SirB1 N-terminal domain-containing protein n=1 Tax=Elliptochloris bilobata TaxID=381761 RepID=A0AAW1S3X9_9CHLO
MYPGEVQSLVRVERQFQVILGCEAPARQALGTWCTLQQRLAAQPAPLAPLATCAAVEEAAVALPRLVTCAGDALEELDDEVPQEGPGPDVFEEEERVRQALDGVASQVAAAAPAGLFQRPAESDSALAVQLAHLHEGLVRAAGFREEPVEWVYTGLGPLLLRDVLASRKGVAASLALLTSCVARRLHVPLLPALPPHAASAGDAALPFQWVVQLAEQDGRQHTGSSPGQQWTCLAGALPGTSSPAHQRAQNWPAHLIWSALVRFR